MSGDIKMDDPPVVVREHYEHIEECVYKLVLFRMSSSASWNP